MWWCKLFKRPLPIHSVRKMKTVLYDKKKPELFHGLDHRVTSGIVALLFFLGQFLHMLDIFINKHRPCTSTLVIAG